MIIRSLSRRDGQIMEVMVANDLPHEVDPSTDICHPQQRRAAVSRTAVFVGLALLLTAPLAMLRGQTMPGPTESLLAGPGALSAEQRKAAEAMVAAAEKVRKGLWELEEIRPLVPEFLEQLLDADRRLLRARLLLHPEGPERVQSLQAYLQRVTDLHKFLIMRSEIDSTRSRFEQSRYAVAEAEFLLAAHAAGHSARVDKPLTREERAAAEKMLGAARAAYEGLLVLRDIRPRSPEFIAVELAYLRLRLNAELLLLAGVERIKALEAYVAAARQTQQVIEGRREIDATDAAINQAAFAWAEAEFLLLTGGTGDPAKAGDLETVKKAIGAMTMAAEGAYAGVVELHEIRARTPEFDALKIATAQRLLDARLMTAPSVDERKKLLDEHVATLTEMKKSLVALNPFVVSVAAVDYAIAEAEFRRGEIAAEPR